MGLTHKVAFVSKQQMGIYADLALLGAGKNDGRNRPIYFEIQYFTPGMVLICISKRNFKLSFNLMLNCKEGVFLKANLCKALKDLRRPVEC